MGRGDRERESRGEQNLQKERMRDLTTRRVKMERGNKGRDKHERKRERKKQTDRQKDIHEF